MFVPLLLMVALPRPRVQADVLLPVIAGSVECIVYAIPRGALGFLEENAHVPALVGGLRSSAEMAHDGGEQCVGALSWARNVNDDRGERHQSRS
jgi:hypothetical protein